MSEEQKPFRVNDRRHFTAEGRPRGEEASAANARPEPAGAAGPPTEPSEAPPEADFAAFVLSLGSRAGVLLAGEGDEPELGEPAARLREARSIIAILEMLKGKTEGRRTPPEDQILEALLYELRMGYLARAGVGGA